MHGRYKLRPETEEGGGGRDEKRKRSKKRRTRTEKQLAAAARLRETATGLENGGNKRQETRPAS